MAAFRISKCAPGQANAVAQIPLQNKHKDKRGGPGGTGSAGGTGGTGKAIIAVRRKGNMTS
jgi:hypothetical protein